MSKIKTSTVLAEEARAIHGDAFMGKSEDKLYLELNSLERSALCLSGGGIRSAAFALGILQALASNPRSANGSPVGANQSFLRGFHYLSTVSGGGYIGSWLSAWISRPDGNFEKVVWPSLVGRNGTPDKEPAPLSWLRENSNYLTPKLGLTSADSWAAAALYIRNMVLNWLVLIPILCIVLLGFKGFAAFMGAFTRIPPDVWWPAAVVGAIAAVALVAALRFTCLYRPIGGKSRATQGQFLAGQLGPAVVAALALSVCLVASATEIKLAGDVELAWNLLAAIGGNPQWSRAHPMLAVVALAAGCGIVLYIVSWLLGAPRQRDWKDLIAWIVAGLIFGSLVGIGVYYHLSFHDFGGSFLGLKAASAPIVAAIILCVPWVFGALLIAEMIFVGLTRYQDKSDADREWLGRAAGWMLVVALVWPITMYLIFVGSEIVPRLPDILKSELAPIGGISGLITVLLGKSRLSPGNGPAKGVKAISANVVLAIAAPIFVAALVIGVSAALDRLLLGHSLLSESPLLSVREDTYDAAGAKTDALWLLGGFVGAVVLAVVASAYINVNRFSLHALYRNRLMRAFLGATNSRRAADPFTNFDLSDNRRMHELWPKEPIDDTNWRPFHVINIALNIVSTKRLAWQERKAESFTASPLHVGAYCNGYRLSTTYGDKKEGLSLGTAMAISGAAASPNMGYHSSPAVTLLMALFNVRLGWWLGNPGDPGNRTFTREGPRLAAAPLLQEMFGLTTDDKPFVYLSDGGHFENLALYEMVRRRCRFIVMSDAGCDPTFAFADLGNAVRKIAVDLGVSISLPDLHDLKPRPADGSDLGVKAQYHAVGVIDYKSADGLEAENGVILYVKAGYHGCESAGIRAYAIEHREFPHEPTSDQWFSESQFESYRALGFEIMDGILRQACRKLMAGKPPTGKPPTLKDVLDLLGGQGGSGNAAPTVVPSA